MSSSRALICSFVFLTVGLTVIFGYCHGSASFHVGLPASITDLQLNIETKGLPALIGLIFTAIGLFLLAWATIGAVAAQFHTPRSAADPL